jgi:hypothetical protein
MRIGNDPPQSCLVFHNPVLLHHRCLVCETVDAHVAIQGFEIRMDSAPFRLSAETTRKWHALAERRRAYFIELYRSGRWRRYYSEDAFLAHMREVMEGVENWAKVMERWPDGAAAPAKVRTAA